MSVVQLVRSSNRETVMVLECFLEKARAGKLLSFAGMAEMVNGTEEAVFTGRYKADPAKAVNASLRLSMRVAQLQNDGVSL